MKSKPKRGIAQPSCVKMLYKLQRLIGELHVRRHCGLRSMRARQCKNDCGLSAAACFSPQLHFQTWTSGGYSKAT